MSDSTEPARVTIVIPVYNEEGILRASVVDLLEQMKRFVTLRRQLALRRTVAIQGAMKVARDLAFDAGDLIRLLDVRRVPRLFEPFLLQLR